MEVVKGPDNNVDLISQWIRTYEKDLLRLCCVYLKDVALAEDAVQETFLKVFLHNLTVFVLFLIKFYNNSNFFCRFCCKV